MQDYKRESFDGDYDNELGDNSHENDAEKTRDPCEEHKEFGCLYCMPFDPNWQKRAQDSKNKRPNQSPRGSFACSQKSSKDGSRRMSRKSSSRRNSRGNYEGDNENEYENELDDSRSVSRKRSSRRNSRGNYEGDNENEYENELEEENEEDPNSEPEDDPCETWFSRAIPHLILGAVIYFIVLCGIATVDEGRICFLPLVSRGGNKCSCGWL